MKDWHNSRFTESCLFLLIILIEAGIFIYLIHGRWIVGGHDGFQYFTIQYCFLDHVVMYGEIPQWSPFMTHGSLTSFGYIATGSILNNALLLTGSLLKSVNFLTIFYAGLFIDELLLLAGVWLLGRRFFASPFTVFFVALSVMGSCIWMLQPWWNFHFFYAIPLILYLIHVFIDSGKWHYAFLAGNLLFLQSLGNLPYCLPVTSLVIFLYIAFYFIFNYRETWPKIKTLNLGWPFVLTALLILASFIALYKAMNFGTDQIISYNSMRNTDWTANLNSFLHYGGKLSWKIWMEMFLRMSPHLDITLYTGIVCVPFILLGLTFNLNKQNFHFLLTIIVLVLFGAGTFVSVWFYNYWPMMKFFHHLSLVSPLIKVLLCFIAGFGFDAVFFNRTSLKNPLLMKTALMIISVSLFGLSLFSWILSYNHEFLADLIKNMVPENLPLFTTLLNHDVMTPIINNLTLVSLFAFILFLVLSFIDRKKHLYPLIVSLLALHCVDIYQFKFSDTKLKAIPLNDEIFKIIDYQPMPYAQRRDLAFWDHNPRAELLKILPVQEPGVFYWNVNAFLFKDELGSEFRTDWWLRSLDDYMKAYWGQSIHDPSAGPLGLHIVYHDLDFPQSHPAILKISGVTEDKIQFFSEAEIVSSDDAIVSKITSAKYKGDILFLSLLSKNEGSRPSSTASNNDLSSTRRLYLDYQVTRFNMNNLDISVNTKDHKSTWLFYSDVWHPLWRATVNGKETPVYKANLAYKAIKLQPGLNTVHFYFKSGLMSALYFIFGLNAIGWIAVIIYLTGRIVFIKSSD